MVKPALLRGGELMLPFDLHRFDPGNESQAAFVYDTFRKSIDHWPWSGMPSALRMQRLKMELASPGTETMVATPRDMPDSFVGWYSFRRPESAIVYAFTKYAARRQGVALAALQEMGWEPRWPTGVVFWTAACARLASGGKPIYFDTRRAFDE